MTRPFNWYGHDRPDPPPGLAELEARTVAAIHRAGDVHDHAIADIAAAPDDNEAARRMAIWQPRITAADAARTALLDQLGAARRDAARQTAHAAGTDLSPWEIAARYFERGGWDG